MKVGISYAVELDEIPEEVEDLLRDVQWDSFGILENIITEVNAGNFATVFDDINNLRKSVQRLDTRLEDCYTILGGYLKVRQRLAERAIGAPPAHEDDIND